jgi:hypothetical protein
MLQIVVDDTYEAHSERDGRIPSFVDDPVEVTFGEALHVRARPLVRGVIVAK